MESELEVKILVVDDRPDKAKALEVLIGDLGKVITVYSGREALRCLLQNDFALILLDVNMPDMDGFETAAMIRQRPSFERTPIIFITSFHDGDNHSSRGYSLGAVDYILAPVIPDVLRAKVNVFADLYRKTHEVKRRAEERLLLLQEQAARGLAEENERRATFLSLASRVLGSSMDSTELLGALARLVTKRFSDLCCIDLFANNGLLERKIGCDSGEERTEIGLPCIEWPYGPESRAFFIAEMSEPSAQLLGLSSDHAVTLTRASVKTLIAAPIRVRGHTMGFLIVCRKKTAPRGFDSLDVATMEDLAQRIGISLDHASIYHEAQEANRIKDEFLAVVSHELRTPLTPILGWTRILNAASVDAHTIKRGLEVIDRNIKAQAKLIDDLLDISRIITGKLRLNIRKVELQKVIEVALDSLRPAAQAKALLVEAEGESNIDIMVDPGRLQQILWNLIFNAIKFTPQNGSIRVEWKSANGLVEIMVSDSGRGISPRFLPFVFDRFRQADSSSTRSDGGLGIGLSITRHLVELHGGTISVLSEGEGKGTRFTVRIPLGIQEPSVDTSKSTPSSEILAASQPLLPSLSGLQILVVDDNQDARELLTILLEQTGAQIHSAESVQEALPIFDANQIDLLVCDLAMPKEDGFEMIRRVRAHPRGTVPAIALSAYCRDQDVRAALKSGFNLHISKPADPAELFSGIKTLMNQASDAVVTN